LPSAGRAHRALADAQVTAALLLRMQQDLRERWGVAAPDFGFLLALQACPKARLARFLQSAPWAWRVEAIGARCHGLPIQWSPCSIQQQVFPW
jgi:DNA polymerase III epsilon subunit-like protein